jgi:hypothetical protein
MADCLIWAMALKACIGENRPYLPIKPYCRLIGSQAGQTEDNEWQ